MQRAGLCLASAVIYGMALVTWLRVGYTFDWVRDRSESVGGRNGLTGFCQGWCGTLNMALAKNFFHFLFPLLLRWCVCTQDSYAY